jgi:hypothetical protein
MLSLEDQIERIADAAFAHTSPVEWRGQTASVTAREPNRRFRRAAVGVAAGVLGVGLVGGLIVLRDSKADAPVTPADSAPSTSREIAPVTGAVTAPPASLDASPVTTTAGVVDSLPGAALDPCSPQGVCTYRSMNDGSLVRLDSRFKNDELPAVTIYGDNRATTVFFDESFAPSKAFLLDVGPGDIGYIWWVAQGAELATVSAFELTGPEAGRLVTQFGAELDSSGDTELVPTRLGFVGLGCCVANPTRPSPEAPIVIPWVDRNGNEIVAEDRAVFVAFVNERLGINVDWPGERADQGWAVSNGDLIPRGMPYLYALDDGRVVAILDGDDATSDPIYLLPDGTSEQVVSPGSVEYVLPDGRFVVRGSNGSFSLTAATPGATSVPPSPSPTTSGPLSTPTESAAPGVQPSRPLVAIDGNGDAVIFDSDDRNPIPLYDGPDIDTSSTIGDGPNGVDRISVAADRSVAYIGLCCAPVVGTVLETTPPAVAVPDAAPRYGSLPTLNPSATLLAVEVSTVVSITDLATGQATTVEPPDGATWETVHDLYWVDDTTLALLGNQADSWSLTIITTDGTSTRVGPTRSFARFEDFGSLRFAGSAAVGEITMHDVDTNRVLSGNVDDYGNNNGSRGSSLAVIELPGSALSAWYFDQGQLVWVDTARTLRVSGKVIPGEYLWARR